MCPADWPLEERTHKILQAAEIAERHPSEAYYALDDPLEAAVFSVLVEIVKEMDNTDCDNGIDLAS